MTTKTISRQVIQHTAIYTETVTLTTRAINGLDYTDLIINSAGGNKTVVSINGGLTPTFLREYADALEEALNKSLGKDD